MCRSLSRAWCASAVQPTCFGPPKAPLSLRHPELRSLPLGVPIGLGLLSTQPLRHPREPKGRQQRLPVHGGQLQLGGLCLWNLLKKPVRILPTCRIAQGCHEAASVRELRLTLHCVALCAPRFFCKTQKGELDVALPQSWLKSRLSPGSEVGQGLQVVTTLYMPVASAARL